MRCASSFGEFPTSKVAMTARDRTCPPLVEIMSLPGISRRRNRTSWQPPNDDGLAALRQRGAIETTTVAVLATYASVHLRVVYHVVGTHLQLWCAATSYKLLGCAHAR